MNDRDRWLLTDDEKFLADCLVDIYRASGPGGQHRNKVSSAIRLRHRPSGVVVIAEESRSQHENKRRAIRRLRLAIAVAVRQPIDASWNVPEWVCRACDAGGRLRISPRNVDYPLVVATVLDGVLASKGSIGDAARRIGVSTAQLARFITNDAKILVAANRIRADFGVRPLTA